MDETYVMAIIEDRLHVNGLLYPKDTVPVLVEPAVLRTLLERAKRAPDQP